MPTPPGELVTVYAAGGQILQERVEAWLISPRREAIPVDVVDLTGDTDATRGYRRSAAATILGADGRDLPVDADRIRGWRFRAVKRVTGPSGRTYSAPLILGYVKAVSRADSDAPVVLDEVASLEYLLHRTPLVGPATVMRWPTAVAGAIACVHLVFPAAIVRVDPRVVDAPVSTKTYEVGESVWTAASDYALCAGAELYCDGGGGFILAPPAVATDEISWTLRWGETLLARSTSEDAEQLSSIAIVRNPDTGVVGMSWDSVPGSRTYVGDPALAMLTGSAGRSGSDGLGLLRSESSPVTELPVGSTDAANQAAAALRAKSVRRASGVTLQQTPHPWQSAGEVVAAVHPDGNSRHVIARMPLSGTDAGAVTPDLA